MVLKNSAKSAEHMTCSEHVYNVRKCHYVRYICTLFIRLSIGFDFTLKAKRFAYSWLQGFVLQLPQKWKLRCHRVGLTYYRKLSRFFFFFRYIYSSLNYLSRVSQALDTFIVKRNQSFKRFFFNIVSNNIECICRMSQISNLI